MAEPHDEAGEQQDQEDGEQVGNGVDDLRADESQPIEQERSQRFAPRTRVGEPAQDEGQPVVADEQPHDDEQSRDDPSRDIRRLRGLDEHVSRRQLLELAFCGPGSPFHQHAMKAQRPPEQGPRDECCQQRPRGAGCDPPRRPELDGFVDCLLETPDGFRGLGLQGLARERVDVERQEGKNIAAADRDHADALQRTRRDRPRRAVVDDAIEEVAGGPGALRGRPGQDRGPENGDLTVVVGQDGGFPGRRRRQELRQILSHDAGVDRGGGHDQRATRGASQPGGKIRRRFAVVHVVLEVR